MHKYNNYFSYFLVSNVVVWYVFTSLMDILLLGKKSLPSFNIFTLISHNSFYSLIRTRLREQQRTTHEYQVDHLTKTAKKRTEQSLTKHSLIKHLIVNPFICLWIYMFTCLYISLSTHLSIDFNDMSIILSFICHLLLPSIHVSIKYTWFFLWHTSPITINDIITKQ